MSGKENKMTKRQSIINFASRQALRKYKNERKYIEELENENAFMRSLLKIAGIKVTVNGKSSRWIS